MHENKPLGSIPPEEIDDAVDTVELLAEKTKDHERARIINERILERRELPTDPSRLELLNYFSKDGKTIDADEWFNVFENAWSKGDDREDTYREKMAAAIDTWNSTPLKERQAFLDSGDYTDRLNKETISLLTSGEIIVAPILKEETDNPPSISEPEPESRAIPKKERAILTASAGRGLLKWFNGLFRNNSTKANADKPGTKKPDFANGTFIIPEESPKPDVPEKPADTEPSERSEIEIPDDIDDDIERPKNIEEPEEIKEPEEVEKPAEIEEPERPEETEEPVDIEESEEPEEPEETEDDAEKPEDNEVPLEEAGEVTDKYEVIKQIKTREVINFLKFLPLASLLALLALQDPLTKVANPADYSLDVSHKKRTSTKEVVPEHDEKKDLNLDNIDEFLQNVHLGDYVELHPGTVYHESSDYEYGGANKFGRISSIEENGIRPEGEYRLNLASFVDSDTGKIVAVYSENDSSDKTLQELSQEVAATHEGMNTELHLHFTDKVSGWSEDIYVQNQTNLSFTAHVSEQTYTITTTEIIEGQGETHNMEAGHARDVVEVYNDDGSTAKFDIRDANGNLRQPGDYVYADDGNIYEIGNIDIQDNGFTKTIDWRKVAFDLGLLGAVGLGLYYSAKSGALSGGGIEVKEREMMELKADEMLKLLDVTQEKAGDNIEQVADQLAQYAEVEAGDEKLIESPIFDGLTDAQRLIAISLLKRRDPATLEVLATEELHMQLDDLIASFRNETESNNGEENA